MPFWKKRVAVSNGVLEEGATADVVHYVEDATAFPIVINPVKGSKLPIYHEVCIMSLTGQTGIGLNTDWYVEPA